MNNHEREIHNLPRKENFKAPTSPGTIAKMAVHLAEETVVDDVRQYKSINITGHLLSFIYLLLLVFKCLKQTNVIFASF